ncbi:GDPD-domain-containing protein [Lindgomyces ingoldianus]|uniref:GDPD-domain-containing protein n=1 Tax=Lindgomyces ingoldianus TaxID=673940 RepID=A0ACB6Q7J9_9PLEO|nr:GDPD-domain-containing protein [Lindgomyces ingoldianus]KAF2462806.1 GDPD-domain-containing protein [Lindgomyces ingoldianus]
MRFGRNLYQNRIPEWAPFYIDYYGLKRRIKLATEHALADHQAEVDLAAFSVALKHEVQKVQTFYTKQHHRLRLNYQGVVRLYEKDGAIVPGELNRPEQIFVLGSCLEYSRDLRRLRWYAGVNSDALEALSRKLDVIASKTGYARLNTAAYEFVSQLETLREMEEIDAIVLKLQSTACGAKDPSFLLRQISAQLSIHVDERLRDALVTDNAKDLVEFLHSSDLPSLFKQTLLYEAILQQSRECALQILQWIGSNLQDVAMGTHRNCIHTLVIMACHQHGLTSHGGNRERYRALMDGYMGEYDDSSSMLSFMLNSLDNEQRLAIVQKDYRGRIPLHYAAEAGHPRIAQALLHSMDKWDLLRPQLPFDLFRHSFFDNGHHSALHLSIMNGHAETTRALLASAESIERGQPEREALGDMLADLLHTALLSHFTEIVEALLDTGLVNLNYVQPNGETALFIASRAGSVEYINMLVQNRSHQAVNPNVAEKSYGWTPLIVACVLGHKAAVEALLNIEVDENHSDAFGWTALDHVAFRGFWPISNLLQPATSGWPRRVPKLLLPKTNALPPCAPSTSRVFVNLGALNARKPRPAIDLSPYLLRYPFNPYPETRFSVRVCGLGMDGHGGSMHLPILDDKTNYPFVFQTDDVRNAKLVFKIYRRSSASPNADIHIGTAVGLLEELGNSLGPGRESLFRDHQIPIIGSEAGEFIGTLTMNFLLVKPFPDPRMPPSSKGHQCIRNSNRKITLIGHRGLGMNSPAFKRIQIGENTIQSFQSTIDLGVSYVEVDVQLTRDHVPVIYHDFFISESGADIAPHNLSFDQFMCISDMQKPSNGAKPPYRIGAGAQDVEADEALPPSALRQRSQSFGTIEDCRTRDFLARIKHTHEFKVKGFKGNIRGAHIHDSFTTLEELLRNLPETVAFDIELKYPMLWEAEDWKMDLYGVEFNLYIDTILDLIYKYGGNRSILFTSFSPELCILAAHKQDTYPVMFLNESNLFPTGDVRASNLQEAIQFARHWNLPGVVMSSEPFVTSPKLVQFVKDAGLICWSFGALNNDPENARAQAAAGLDAIIVDSVALINHSFKDELNTAKKEEKKA